MPQSLMNTVSAECLTVTFTQVRGHGALMLNMRRMGDLTGTEELVEGLLIYE